VLGLTSHYEIWGCSWYIYISLSRAQYPTDMNGDTDMMDENMLSNALIVYAK
jgi:hypothetical protein